MKRSSPLRILLSMMLSHPKTPALLPAAHTSLETQLPLLDDRDGWKAHWKEQGQSWRTEPEIDVERQKYLAERRAIMPNIEKGIYPFKDIKLSRADVEWLLSTHENGRGPVDWSDVSQRQREGLDLRGADLGGVYLFGLPLTRLRGGLTTIEWAVGAPKELFTVAGVLMSEAYLGSVHLEGAELAGAQLERAYLWGAHLDEADLTIAQLKGAMLGEAQLEGAELAGAQLEGANLTRAKLKGAQLMGALLKKAGLAGAQLEEANLGGAQLEDADLTGAQLKGANLYGALLKRTILWRAHLEETILNEAHLERTILNEAHLEGTVLNNVLLGDKERVGPQLADAQWGNTNLAVVDWSQVRILGDEQEARQRTETGRKKDHKRHLADYQKAIRANRQLAVALQSQGLNEDAARFAYRAQVLQRKVLWKKRSFWKWFGSATLALLAGYGYRMWRIIAAYLVIVIACALTYFILGIYFSPNISPSQAFLESIMAFHGRVFFELFNPGEPQIWVTAFEAVAGLIIEGIFIAMLAQRFFGK